MKKAGVLFHPRVAAARDMVQQLSVMLGESGIRMWACSAWEEEKAREQTGATELIICLGGDGTILRAARIAFPNPIPILGVNFGRLGFMAELSPDDALAQMPSFLRGEGWIDERATLQAELSSTGPTGAPPFQALNDVVVGSHNLRLIHVKTSIDGEVLTTYRCDAMIVASATGSTGYSLAAGGPILHPQSSGMVLQAVAPHLSPGNAIVLPAESVVEMEMGVYHNGTLSLDGQVEVPVNGGDIVRVKHSPYAVRLLRADRSAPFFKVLMNKLKTS